MKYYILTRAEKSTTGARYKCTHFVYLHPLIHQELAGDMSEGGLEKKSTNLTQSEIMCPVSVKGQEKCFPHKN